VHVRLFAENSASLEPYFRFPVLPAGLARKLVSKRFQAEYAGRVGVPTPLTRSPDSADEAERLADELTYPCILKPDYSRSGARVLSGRKLLVVDSPRELLDAWAALNADHISCVVQEIVPGPDTALVSYLGFWDGEGRERASITKRKLRQFPALYGNGSIQRTEDLPLVAEYSRRLLQALDFRGFAGVEFKEDPRDGSLKFIEINPRSSAMNELAVVAGVDFPWIAYRSLAGQFAPTEPPAFRAGVTCVNEEWDVQAFLEQYRAGEISFGEWRKSLRGAHRIIAARDDPKPFVAGLLRGVTRLFLPADRS
jgi:predicted ATP-grasp superfamily ATP-dependent carboligase